MQKALFSFMLLGLLTAPGIGQISVGARLGISPVVTPGTNHLIVNRNQVDESLFNITNVRYSPQPGLLVRFDIDKFWIMGEVIYGQHKTEYSLQYVTEIATGSGPAIFCEKRGFLEIPLSVGVKLGKAEFFSGFNVSREFMVNCELSKVEGFSFSHPETHLGWHSGIGYGLGPVFVDVRYHQQFCHYGHGRFISGQELLLKNAPGRLLVSLGFRI